MCCACDGSCNHVGPHSFCPAHGGGAWAGLIWPSSTTAIPAPSEQALFRIAVALERIAAALEKADKPHESYMVP